MGSRSSLGAAPTSNASTTGPATVTAQVLFNRLKLQLMQFMQYKFNYQNLTQIQGVWGCLRPPPLP